MPVNGYSPASAEIRASHRLHHPSGGIPDGKSVPLADINFRTRQHRNSSIGVRQVCQGIVMVLYHDPRRCDGVCSTVSVGGQHDIKSATEGCPAGGIDAKFSLKPAHDKTLDVKAIKLRLQGSQIKPVRRSLLEDQFI
jgi:hypothetical protein